MEDVDWLLNSTTRRVSGKHDLDNRMSLPEVLRNMLHQSQRKCLGYKHVHVALGLTRHKRDRSLALSVFQHAGQNNPWLHLFSLEILVERQQSQCDESKWSSAVSLKLEKGDDFTSESVRC